MQKAWVIPFLSTFLLVSSFIHQSSAQNSPYIGDVLEKAVAGVVTVAVFKTDFANRLMGMRSESNPQIDSLLEIAYGKALDMAGAKGRGSGFAIEHAGEKYIVTNAHVIDNAANSQGSLFIYSIAQNRYEVEVIGGDTFYDIAVLKFVDTPGAEIIPINFNDGPVPKLGEKVFAIGNPLGEYPFTVTDGIISAKNRVRGGITGKFGFLQSSATTIWGNSGGPLVNENGKAVGINSQIAPLTDYEGTKFLQPQINFALEAHIAERLVKDIIDRKGRVQRAYYGIELSQAYDVIRTKSGQQQRESEEFPVFTGAVSGSPADLEIDESLKGAQVIAVNGEKIRNLEEALGAFEMSSPNSKLTLTLVQNDEEIEVSIEGTALQTVELIDIAKHAIGSHGGEMVLNEASATTMISFPIGRIYREKEGKYFKTVSKSGEESKFYDVLSAGLVTGSRRQNMWKILRPEELGAAIKMAALSGVIDFTGFEQLSGEDFLPVGQMEQFRLNLSDDPKQLKKVLWY